MIFGQERLPPDVYPTRPPAPAEDPFRLPEKVRPADRPGSLTAYHPGRNRFSARSAPARL